MNHLSGLGLGLLASLALLTGCARKETAEAAAPAAPPAASPPAATLVGKAPPRTYFAQMLASYGKQAKATDECPGCSWNDVKDVTMTVTFMGCMNSAAPHHCHLEVLDSEPDRKTVITQGSSATRYNFNLTTSANSEDGNTIECRDLAVSDWDPDWLDSGSNTCRITDKHGTNDHYFRAWLKVLEEDPSKKEVIFFFQDTPFASDQDTKVHNGEGHTHKPD